MNWADLLFGSQRPINAVRKSFKDQQRGEWIVHKFFLSMFDFDIF